MMNEEERQLLLDISFGDIRLEEIDSKKVIQAIKSAMQEIDEHRKTPRTEQGEEIVTDDEVITDDGETTL